MIEIGVTPRRYAFRVLRVYNRLDAYQRFIDEANELGYNIISVQTLSDFTLLVTYEATHDTQETEDDSTASSS